ncbi:MAG: hypothetical protein DRP09_10515 [Candidatus Thorarchaeota archaeon]|nr:MAG: hypothetical protein DRP09_10515 [Candidatus Thorarchaeota archaeon]
MTHKHETEHTHRFYIYSLRTGRTDITLSIPARSEHEAEELLSEVTMHPENWNREKGVEDDLQGMTTTGKRKSPREWHQPLTDGSGPMYG